MDDHGTFNVYENWNLTIFHMVFDLCLFFHLLIAATVMIQFIIVTFRYVLDYENWFES